MKNLTKLALLMCVIGCSKGQNEEKTLHTPTETKTETKESPYSVEDDVVWMQDQTKCRGSKDNSIPEATKKIIAKQMDRILNQEGGALATKQAFVFLICKESQYRPRAKSPANAYGLTQMILSTAQSEADKLSLGKITEEDLYNTEISILLGYRHFLVLEKMFNGNIARMSSSYNGGPGSPTVKSFTRGGMGVHETDAYAAAFFDMSEERRIAKEMKK